jgi:hypothetical protein
VKKFIIMAVSLLLTALLALAGCMYAIGENKAESKPYDMGETVSVAPEDTPEAQKEMEKKFSVYNHVTEENGKKILTLFSEEQAEEQWTKRQSGEEFRLTYDEILFLINDSVRIYETYDEIILPDAEVSNAAADAIGGSPLFGLARTIRPSPAEAAALTFHGETEHFALRMREITDIIVYRLWMLDSRMKNVGLKGVSYGGETYFSYVSVEGVNSDQFPHRLLNDEVFVEFPYDHIYFTYGSCWALLLDEGENSTSEDYIASLVKHLYCRIMGGNGFEEFEAEYPLLFFMGSEADMMNPQTFETSDLLYARAPVWELKASYLTAYQSFELSSIASAPDIWFFSGEEETYCTRLYGDTCWKYLGDPEAVVNAIVGGKPIGILGEGEAFYRVDLDNGTAILLPATEEYDGDTLAAAQIVAADGGVPGELYLCVSKEFADLIRRIAKPYVEYHLPDTKPAE